MGQWKNDLKNGKGIYVNFNGVKMKGQTYKNHIEGEALVEYPDGWWYLRTFKQGKKIAEWQLVGVSDDEVDSEDQKSPKWN